MQLLLQNSYSLPVGFQQIHNLCLSKTPSPVHSHPERVAQVFLFDFSLQKMNMNSASDEAIDNRLHTHFPIVISTVIAGSATFQLKVLE